MFVFFDPVFEERPYCRVVDICFDVGLAVVRKGDCSVVIEISIFCCGDAVCPVALDVHGYNCVGSY